MGNAESQPVRNVDKRTARRDHAPKFMSAISGYRYEHGLLGADAEPEGGEHAGGRGGRGGRDAAGDDGGSGGGDGGGGGGGTKRLRVCVRFRPIFSHETQAGEFEVLSSSRSGLTVHDCRIEADCRHLFISHHSFAFDRVFDGRTSSEAVYADAVAPLVRLAAHGEAPACIMMYGQTGSGKTYTMRAIHQLMTRELFGGPADDDGRARRRPLVDIAAGDEVTLSCVELSTSGPRDMLREGASAALMTDHSGAVQVVPSAEVPVLSAGGLLALLEYTAAIRATAATGVHDASSRSHAMYTLHFRKAGSEVQGQGGSLTLCDLAGSEARIDTDKHDAKRTKESAAINSSLMSLKTAVRSIARGETWQTAAGGRAPLTQLLRPCFVHRDAHTVVLATASPAAKDTEHSLNTLRHACVMDGRVSEKDEEEKPWMVGGGGEVAKQPLGEIDFRATQARRQAEADLLRERRSGGGGGGGGFGYSDREGVGGDAQAAFDARREARAEAAEFKRAERRAMRALGDASGEQQAALLEERGRMEGGPALNRFQYQRLRQRVLEQQAARALEEERLAAEQPPPPPRPPPPQQQEQRQPPPPSTTQQQLQRHASDEADGGGQRRAMFGRRASSPALRPGETGEVRGVEEGSFTAGGQRGLSERQPSRGVGRRGVSHAAETSATDATESHGALPLRGGSGGRKSRGSCGGGCGGGSTVAGGWPAVEVVESGASPHDLDQRGASCPSLASAAQTSRHGAVKQRREQAEEARKQALLQKQQQKQQPREPQAPPPAAADEFGGGDGGSLYLEEAMGGTRHDAVRLRREQAEEAKRQALIRRLEQQKQQAQAPGAAPPDPDDGWDAQMEREAARREAVRLRREQAEEARKQALMQKLQTKEPVYHGSHGGGHGPPPAEAYDPGAYEEVARQQGDVSLEPSRDDARREAARQRREQADEARRQALLQRRGGGGGGGGGGSAGEVELERLQILLDGATSDASRAGLKKQIATIRAAHIREVRQREQAQREARRVEQARLEEARKAEEARRAAAQQLPGLAELQAAGHIGPQPPIADSAYYY